MTNWPLGEMWACRLCLALDSEDPDVYAATLCEFLDCDGRSTAVIACLVRILGRGP
jgi:hypothetical protein